MFNSRVSDFMSPTDYAQRRGGPRAGDSYRAVRREAAKVAYRNRPTPVAAPPQPFTPRRPISKGAMRAAGILTSSSRRIVDAAIKATTAGISRPLHEVRAITRPFSETVAERASQDSAFAEALAAEDLTAEHIEQAAEEIAAAPQVDRVIVHDSFEEGVAWVSGQPAKKARVLTPEQREAKNKADRDRRAAKKQAAE